MRLGVTIRGDLAAIVQDETVETARGLRDGIDTARAALQQELRDQSSRAFKGRSIANSWRSRTFPQNPLTVTMHPSALVWTRAPNIVSAFEEGQAITVKNGKYLCWPTSFNAARGRRNSGSRGGLRVTPEEMAAAKGQSVVLPSRTRGLFLWCLRVRQASSRGGRSGRGRGRVRLYVGNRNVEILTGRIRAGERAEKAAELVARGIVPMFFLSRQVTPGKRLDVAGAAAKADAALPSKMERALARRS